VIDFVRDQFLRRLDVAHSWIHHGAEVKPDAFSNQTCVEQRTDILLLPVDPESLAALSLQIIDHC